MTAMRFAAVLLLVSGCGAEQPQPRAPRASDRETVLANPVAPDIGVVAAPSKDPTLTAPPREAYWYEDGVLVIASAAPFWCGRGDAVLCSYSRTECDAIHVPPETPCEQRYSAVCFRGRHIVSGDVSVYCSSTMPACVFARQLYVTNGKHSGVRDCFVSRYQPE